MKAENAALNANVVALSGKRANNTFELKNAVAEI
jgi:hypothetical protein